MTTSLGLLARVASDLGLGGDLRAAPRPREFVWLGRAEDMPGALTADVLRDVAESMLVAPSPELRRARQRRGRMIHIRWLMWWRAREGGRVEAAFEPRMPGGEHPADEVLRDVEPRVGWPTPGP